MTDRIKAPPLKSFFLVAAANTAALMLSTHNAWATDAPQPLFKNDSPINPDICFEESKAFHAMKELGQQPVVVAMEPFVEMKDKKVVTAHNKIIYTSDSEGKAGYILAENGCIPVSDGSTGADRPTGVKIIHRIARIRIHNIARIRIHNKEQEGLSPSALMSNFVNTYDPLAAQKQCNIMRADQSTGVQNCGPHDHILEEAVKEGQHVMLQAVTLSDEGKDEEFILTVLGCTERCEYPKSGENTYTTKLGMLFSTKVYDEIGYTTHGIDLFEKQKSVSPKAGPN